MVLKCLYGNMNMKVWDLMVLEWAPDGPEMACSLWRTYLLLQGHLSRLGLDFWWVLWIAGMVFGLFDLVMVMQTSYQRDRHVHASPCCW